MLSEDPDKAEVLEYEYRLGEEQPDDEEKLLEQPADEEEDLESARNSELDGDSSEAEVQGNGTYIQEIAAWIETDSSQMRRSQIKRTI
jgi:hypothetical protein